MWSQYILTVLSVAPFASSSYTGKATLYYGNVKGNSCGFNITAPWRDPINYAPTRPYMVAISSSNWNPSSCGSCISIQRGPDSWFSLKATVADERFSCETSNLLLFPEAWTHIVGPDLESEVTWDWVPCENPSPIFLASWQGGSDVHAYFSILNENIGATALEWSKNWGSTWGNSVWLPGGTFAMNTTARPLTVKLTSVRRQRITIENVMFNDHERLITAAKSNFKYLTVTEWNEVGWQSWDELI
ncbi:hypothetical protein K469DRAFT_684606 [Zopfia rhizophila CBS 207.26]|uniref:Uncharacterized protein n=1 Tax=Zopfia rhizophila CBS 207.26 TaxID=1314779 RepID=A0A6A6ECQ8_9PEZI|nr:hypothetical protein K469DRAFT_684606 [Zopfia rhizophila CBS 207.26]